MVGSNTATCLAVLSCIAGLGMASNILLASPAGTQSQVNFYGEIVRALTERGHTVSLEAYYICKCCMGKKFQNSTANINNKCYKSYFSIIFENSDYHNPAKYPHQHYMRT